MRAARRSSGLLPRSTRRFAPHSRHFFHVPGHEDAAGAAQVAARRDGYVIVEKLGRAGDIAEALDERSPEERGRIPKT
jgi:hypothetical protein